MSYRNFISPPAVSPGSLFGRLIQEAIKPQWLRRSQRRPKDCFQAWHRIQREIKQTLGVQGCAVEAEISLEAQEGFRCLWDALRPVTKSGAFEEAVDRVRARALALAQSMGDLNGAKLPRLRRQQALDLQATFDLYSFVVPKFLVGVVLLSRRLRSAAEAASSTAEAGEAGGTSVWRALGQICQWLPAKLLNRTAGQGDWDTYLTAASWELAPHFEGQQLRRFASRLREEAEAACASIEINLEREELGEMASWFEKHLCQLEASLPGLLLGLMILQISWAPAHRILWETDRTGATPQLRKAANAPRVVPDRPKPVPGMSTLPAVS